MSENATDNIEELQNNRQIEQVQAGTKRKHTKRYFGLNLVRCLSMLGVFVFHYFLYLSNDSVGSGALQKAAHILGSEVGLGPVCVCMFLMLSGFLLVNSNDETLNLKVYFWKRFKTIFPIYWFCYFLVGLGSTQHTYSKPLYFLLTVIGMDGYFGSWFPVIYQVGTWFIGAIVAFYVVFPLMRKFMMRMPKIFFVVFLIANLLTQYFRILPIVVDIDFIVCFFSCAMGMLLRYYIHIFNRIPNYMKLLGSVLLFVIVLKIPVPITFLMMQVQVSTFFLFVAIFSFGSMLEPFYQLKKARKYFSAVSILANNSFVMFLLHLAVLNFVLKIIKTETLSQSHGMLIGVLLLFLAAVCLAGIIVNEIFLMIMDIIGYTYRHMSVKMKYAGAGVLAVGAIIGVVSLALIQQSKVTDTKRLEKLGVESNHVEYHIDGMNVSRYNCAQDMLNVAGWAFDETKAVTYANIWIQIGDKLYDTEVCERSDIANAYHNDKYESCGFTAAIDQSQLPEDSSEIYLICKDRSGKMYQKIDSGVKYDAGIFTK